MKTQEEIQSKIADLEKEHDTAAIVDKKRIRCELNALRWVLRKEPVRVVSTLKLKKDTV